MDMELVEQAEANYKVREDLGRGDWHYGYRHRRMERGNDEGGEKCEGRNRGGKL